MSLVSTLVGLLLFEQGLRVYLFGWHAFSYRDMYGMHSVGESDLLQPSSIREILFELKPNLDESFKLVPFVTNSRGLRDREYSLAKPPHTFRVAVLGDSFTMPAGIRIEDAYHTRIEDELNASHQERHWEFVNFSASGYQLVQYLAVLKEKAIRYDPDLILIGFCSLNDQRVFSAEDHPFPFAPHRQKNGFWTSYARLIIKAGFRAGFRRDAPVKENRVPTPEQERYLEVVFGQIREAARGIPVVVAYLSLVHPVPPAIESLARSAGLRFVDVSGPFQSKRQQDYWVHPFDKHPGVEANRLFAEQLKRYLEAERLLPG
jgi:hypothetical protein